MEVIKSASVKWTIQMDHVGDKKKHSLVSETLDLDCMMFLGTQFETRAS